MKRSKLITLIVGVLIAGLGIAAVCLTRSAALAEAAAAGDKG